MLDLEHRRKRDRINMEHRINKKGTQTTTIAMNATVRGGWKEQTDKLNHELGITNNTKPHIRTKPISQLQAKNRKNRQGQIKITIPP